MRRIYSLFVLFALLALAIACNKEDEPVLEFDPYCDLKPEFSADGGSMHYKFSADYDWRIECADEWVSVEPESGTKLDGSFTINVESHDAGEVRTSSITIILDNGRSLSLPIVQRMRERYDVEPVDAYIVDAEASMLEIEVNTNIEYTIEIPVGKSWIKLLETRSMRAETLSFQIEENLSEKSRVAVVEAHDVRNSDEVIHTFTIVQSAPGEATNEILYESNSVRVDLNTTDGFGSAFAIHLFDGRNGRIVFNDEIVAIPHRAFAGNSEMSNIKLPRNLRRVDEEAFEGCSSLEILDLPSGLSTLGYRAFANCTGITKFVLPASLSTLGGSLFDGCSGDLVVCCKVPAQKGVFDEDHWLFGSAFAAVAVKNNLGRYAFYGYEPLREISFGSSCRGVDQGAFEHCTIERVVAESMDAWCSISFTNASANPLHTGESHLIIDNSEVAHLEAVGIKSIGSYAFYNYNRLESIMLDDNVMSIGMGAFGECSFESAYLGSSIVSVGRAAFENCHIATLEINFNTPNFEVNATRSNHWLYGLLVDTVIFGNDVEMIGDFALSALNLGTVSIGENVAAVGRGAFANCDNLYDVTLGNGVNKICEHAFFECAKIETITLPESLEVLEDYALNGCESIISITIPERVTTIGEYCFANCSSLETLYLMPTTPPSLENIYAIPDGVDIFVPSESLDLYRTAEVWRRLADAIQ